MPKSDPIRRQVEAQAAISDEAFSALNDADDALARSEDRNTRRRTSRTPSTNGAMPELDQRLAERSH